MPEFELPAETRSLLREVRLAPEGAVVLTEMIMEELIEVASAVGRDYDEDEGDYPNLAGLMCSGRTRNRVARRVRSGELSEDLDVAALGSGPSIVLRGGGTGVHPYSSGSGDTPILQGSETKQRILQDSM